MIQITLKSARIRVGLTQKQAATMAGIHPQTLGKYEKDSTEIRDSLVKKLAEIYSVQPDYIFLGTLTDFNRYIENNYDAGTATADSGKAQTEK